MIGFEHPGFQVSDLERSIEFYEKIGFKVLRKTSTPHAMMYLGDSIIEITQASLDPNQPYSFHLALHTDNMKEDVEMLRENGIEISEIQTFTGEMLQKVLNGVVEYADPKPISPKLYGCMQPSEKWKRVAFKDPDGIHIEMWQRI